VQLLQPGDDLLERRVAGPVKDERPDLGAEEVIRAGGAERSEPEELLAGHELQYRGRVREVPELRLVGRGQPPDIRSEGGGAGPPLRFRQDLEDRRAERVRSPALVDELLGGRDDLQRAGLTLVAGVAPGGDAVAAEDDADRLRLLALDRGDVEPELEAGAPPRHPGHAAAEALAGELLPVRGRREGDARVRVQVVDVRRRHQAVHRRVDRRSRAALAERAEVERGDHFVFALDARVDTREGLQRVEAEHGQARRGERAEVAARALHPEQLRRLAGDRVGRGALSRSVAAGVVGVAGVGAQAVAPREQRGDGLGRRGSVGQVGHASRSSARGGRWAGGWWIVRHIGVWRTIHYPARWRANPGRSGCRGHLDAFARLHQAPQPAAEPPMRSATIFSA
jgi:hypothetical protein